MSLSRIEYEIELTKMLLRKTVNDFGPFKFERVNQEANFNRGRREVAAGTYVNMFANPLPVQRFASDRELQVVPIPIMKGLLGYRVLVANKSIVQSLASITQQRDLQAYTAGQVAGWVDVRVYHDNALPVVTGPTFNILFDMLSHGRFDYLPLGVAEVHQSLANRGDQAAQFDVVPNIVLYYSFPVYYQVSKKHPLLAKRLQAGLEASYLDGSFDALFTKHFAEHLERLKDEQLRVFFMQNTNLPKPLQASPPLLVNSKNIVLFPPAQPSSYSVLPTSIP